MSIKIIIGLVILVTIIIYYLYVRSINLSNYIGIYVAPDSFLRDANISAAVLIISDVSTFGTLSGYLMMGPVITPIDIGVSLFSSNGPLSVSIDMEHELPLPSKLTMRMHHGRIVFEDEDNVYLVLDAMNDV